MAARWRRDCFKWDMIMVVDRLIQCWAEPKLGLAARDFFFGFGSGPGLGSLVPIRPTLVGLQKYFTKINNIDTVSSISIICLNRHALLTRLYATWFMILTFNNHFAFPLQQDVLTEYEESVKKRHSLKIDPGCLKWTPFVMPQQQQQQPSKSQPT